MDTKTAETTEVKTSATQTVEQPKKTPRRRVATGPKSATGKTSKPKAAKAKSASKPKQRERRAAAPKVNPHVAAGLSTGGWTGPSEMVNANRKVKIMVRDGRDTGSMTTRMQQSLYALRKCYGTKQFGAQGFDNGVLSNLAAAGLITFSGGQEEVIDGKPYLLDGATPVMVKVTAKGQKYGTA